MAWLRAAPTSRAAEDSPDPYILSTVDVYAAYDVGYCADDPYSNGEPDDMPPVTPKGLLTPIRDDHLVGGSPRLTPRDRKMGCHL